MLYSQINEIMAQVTKLVFKLDSSEIFVVFWYQIIAIKNYEI